MYTTQYIRGLILNNFSILTTQFEANNIKKRTELFNIAFKNFIFS